MTNEDDDIFITEYEPEVYTSWDNYVKEQGYKNIENVLGNVSWHIPEETLEQRVDNAENHIVKIMQQNNELKNRVKALEGKVNLPEGYIHQDWLINDIIKLKQRLDKLENHSHKNVLEMIIELQKKVKDLTQWLDNHRNHNHKYLDELTDKLENRIKDLEELVKGCARRLDSHSGMIESNNKQIHTLEEWKDNHHRAWNGELESTFEKRVKDLEEWKEDHHDHYDIRELIARMDNALYKIKQLEECKAAHGVFKAPGNRYPYRTVDTSIYNVIDKKVWEEIKQRVTRLVEEHGFTQVYHLRDAIKKAEGGE